ncbi:ribonuclease H-like domain-containing protein [Tanacetum coccineum]
MSNSGLEEFQVQQPEFEGYGPKASKSVCKDTSNEIKKTLDAPLIKELVSDEKKEKHIVFPTKIEFVKRQEKPVRKPVKLTTITIKGKGWNMAPRAVLMKIGLRPLNTARPINTAHPKTTVYSARPMSFNNAKGKVNTARPKAVNTARPNSAVVNAVRANQANAGHLQKEDRGYFDSGCSRHMTGNMSYLTDFKEFDGGYVTFGGGARGEKITGKGTLKTGKLDFEDVYFVKELQFNLFSVLQICDKKNRVLFTDTGCFVLSPNFKLADESQILLKIPRKNNFFSVDIKNIVPKESLTCLVAKATLDESMLWHRRPGHINFKTINKMVKDNLVRGLLAKHFENNQTCVACLKGKQHKASCIKREYSIARTPQQNGVVEKRNRTLIEAARTIGRTPALSFMRPFGCHFTILNTLDHLGKFDGKSDDGFFVGYSLSSKKFRVYNIRTKKIEENLHIRFLEDKPIVTGSEESNDACHSSKETESSQDYIVMPLWNDSSMFDSSSKNTSPDERQPSSDDEKKNDEGVSKASGIDNQERPESSTLNINTAGPSINTASANFKIGSLNINTVSPIVITTRSNRSQNVSDTFSLGRSATLEATHDDLFGDETEMDMSNLTTSYQVPTAGF